MNPSRAAAWNPPRVGRLNRLSVFIADDSLDVRERLVALLAEVGGVEIAGQARNVQEAIAGIRRVKPEAVILDIRMPGGTGIDVLRNIKQERPALVVIVLTNYPYSQYRRKCREAGADYFFDKSTEFNKVTEVFKWLAPVH